MRSACVQYGIGSHQESPSSAGLNMKHNAIITCFQHSDNYSQVSTCLVKRCAINVHCMCLRSSASCLLMRLTAVNLPHYPVNRSVTWKDLMISTSLVFIFSHRFSFEPVVNV